MCVFFLTPALSSAAESGDTDGHDEADYWMEDKVTDKTASLRLFFLPLKMKQKIPINNCKGVIIIIIEKRKDAA